ncbi:hypothetical protein QJS66_12950 [Kocuria rhizophila]|nr:hypothetical protein QJS66_12950 [Kocuria rhizophila]
MRAVASPAGPRTRCSAAAGLLPTWPTTWAKRRSDVDADIGVLGIRGGGGYATNATDARAPHQGSLVAVVPVMMAASCRRASARRPVAMLEQVAEAADQRRPAAATCRSTGGRPPPPPPVAEAGQSDRDVVLRPPTNHKTDRGQQPERRGRMNPRHAEPGAELDAFLRVETNAASPPWWSVTSPGVRPTATAWSSRPSPPAPTVQPPRRPASRTTTCTTSPSPRRRALEQDRPVPQAAPEPRPRDPRACQPVCRMLPMTTMWAAFCVGHGLDVARRYDD